MGKGVTVGGTGSECGPLSKHLFHGAGLCIWDSWKGLEMCLGIITD